MPPHTQDEGQTIRLQHLLAALLIGALVILLNLPLVLNITTHVIGRPFDDVFEVLWQLNHVSVALFETHTNPFYTPDVFYPGGWYTASGAQPTWYFILFSPLVRLFGPVIAYNLIILSLFSLAGFGAYLFACALTGDRVAALLSACAYLAAPTFALQMNGFVNMLSAAGLLPLAFWATHRAVTERSRSAWKWVAAAGLFLAGSILGQWYFLFMASLPLASYALTLPSTLSRGKRLGRLAIIGLVGLIALAPFALITLRARQAMLPSGARYALADVAQMGFSPDYLLAPNLFHPMWRDSLASLFPVSGEWDIVSVGIATCILAIVGGIRGQRRIVRSLLVAAVVSFVLGLGPFLRWRGQLVEVGAPDLLVHSLSTLLGNLTSREGTIPVPLPGLLLYKFVPFYASMRVWARYAVPLILMAAALAGLGASYLRQHGPWARLVIGTLWALVLFEGVVVPYRDFTAVSVNDRSVNDWLRAQPPGTSIIEYPRPWFDKLAMYSQSLHHQSVVNGYMSYQPDFIQAVDPVLGNWPNREALPLLRSWGIDYIVMSTLAGNPKFDEDIWPTVSAMEEICLVKRFPDAYGFGNFSETFVYSIAEPGQPCAAALSEPNSTPSSAVNRFDAAPAVR